MVSSPAEHCCLGAGATGLLVDEEARLLRIRQETEKPVRDELQRARLELEVRPYLCLAFVRPV